MTARRVALAYASVALFAAFGAGVVAVLGHRDIWLGPVVFAEALIAAAYGAAARHQWTTPR